ncbi:MAG: MBOAT family O-acyltransferase [Bacteroidales bacterium]|nr:MBOAT family O-acyltransferase [Bacteroidales bacterium]
MPFNSIEYIIFLILTTLGFFITPHRARWLWLLAASSYFYSQSSILYLGIFILILVFNYFASLQLGKRAGHGKKRVFIITILINIAILAFFKYSGAFDSILEDLSTWDDSFFAYIAFPLGISYFVFTLLAYLIELKRGKIEAEKHPGIFLSSFMFFPKIAQGPIERPGNIMPQFRERHNFSLDRTVSALKLIVWGLFKKLVIADRLAIYVNTVYNNHDYHNGTSLMVATIFYSFQIYADFSAYTDIAIGSGRLMGFELSKNFNRPYFAASIKEFWNRWHISFSLWLRDYLFLPLAYWFAGKFRGLSDFTRAVEKLIYALAIIITFFICGLWHGEGLNYIVWGLLFGVGLTFANYTRSLGRKLRKRAGISRKSVALKAFNVLITFAFVSFAWIFFRSENIYMAGEIVGKVTTQHGSMFTGKPSDIIFSVTGIVVLLGVELRQELKTGSHLPFESGRWLPEQLFYAVLIVLILVLGVFDGGQFIYFQF